MFKNWEILKKLNTEIFRIPLTPTKIFLILGETNLSYWGYCSTGRPFQNFGSVGRQNKNKQHFKIRQYCIVEKIMKNIFLFCQILLGIDVNVKEILLFIILKILVPFSLQLKSIFKFSSLKIDIFFWVWQKQGRSSP